MIKKLKTIASTAALAATLVLGAQAAQAATFSFSKSFGGADLAATLEMTQIGTTQQYDVIVANTTPVPALGTNTLSGLGFGGIDGLLATATDSSLFKIATQGAFPGFKNIVSVCLSDMMTNTCGGGNQGVAEASSHSFKITFNQVIDFAELRTFVRYQSAGTGGQSTTFESSTPGVIPLPAAGWLLLMGIGGLGVASRRRKKALMT